MILVLAGTKDGRELISLLTTLGYPVTACVFSDYGRELIQDTNVIIHTGPLDDVGFTTFIQEQEIEILIDASHPYAVNVSRNAMAACQHTNIHYLRYERPTVPMPSYEGLHLVTDYQQAAEVAATLGKTVFLTTGSRHLKLFRSAVCLQQHRLIARVLPEPGVLSECQQHGFMPNDMIAMQGPFSHDLNVALFKEYGAEVIITKNSGQVGGSDTKITAAIALGLPIVVIDRPAMFYSTIVTTLADVIQFVKENQS